MRGRILLIGLCLWFVLGGCSHIISNEALDAVDPLVDFAQVKADPGAHQGKTLVLGGLLVESRVMREGTDLEVLIFRLDRWGRPLDVDESGGRFIARTERFLDPELFKAGLLVTLTGQVIGEEVRPLKGVDYHYPVFAVGELHLWQSPAQTYGYPVYYSPAAPWGGPYYDPFWHPYDPFWPSYNPYWIHRPGWRYR